MNQDIKCLLVIVLQCSKKVYITVVTEAAALIVCHYFYDQWVGGNYINNLILHYEWSSR